MFDELTKYKNSGHFFFSINDNLKDVCNAPTNKGGIYIVYALKDGQIDGSTLVVQEKLNRTAHFFIREAGLGGLKDRLVNGKQFGSPRRNSWKTRVQDEGIEALDIYWYATHDENFIDCPRILENKLLQKHQRIFRRLPRWNNEL